MEQENRVVVLIDMDCFYCQVEEKLDPELKGKPIAVVQYNPWKGGGIIAVNYVARARGVTRHMRGDEAREKCPEIALPSVPCQRGKADISKYRDAGKEVARVLQKFTPLLERASIDEAYLDITATVQERLKTLNTNTISSELIRNTFALGYDSIEEFISDVHNCDSDSIEFDYENAKQLLVGAVVVSEIRAAVYHETGYTCSAGIAHNKILAKLVCGMNKPNKQTVLPKHSINILYRTLSVKKVKHLGGKFGDTICEVLKITNMGELQRFPEKELQARFDEKNGTWLYNIARGIDLDPVQARFNPKSIGCCKQLRGKSALYDLDSLKKWLKDLGDEIEDRLEKDALENNRNPKQMVVSFWTQGNDGRDASSSRSYNFVADDELCGDFFANKAFDLVMDSLEGVKPTGEEKNRKLKGPIKFLGISVGKFEDHSESKKIKKIIEYFSAGSANVTKEEDKIKESTCNKNNKKNKGKDLIMQRFLQTNDNCTNNKMKIEIDPANKTDKLDVSKLISETDKDYKNAGTTTRTEECNTGAPLLESPLDKQESFFARFLNKEVDDKSRAITPQCNVVSCGDNSNDTDYSGSTIDMEINKSIALFDEDIHDVERVKSMRDLLNKSNVLNEDSSEEDKMQDNCNNVVNKQTSSKNYVKEQNISPEKLETFKCTECGKRLPIQMFETHSDYHFALKLREEDRRVARDERQRTKPKDSTPKEEKKSKTEDQNKNNTSTSIANFLVKVDDTKPTQVCSECGKRVASDKFPEHLDFHEAQKLYKVLNNKRSTFSTNHLISGGVKRKRKSVSPVKKQKLPCSSRSIDSFFR